MGGGREVCAERRAFLIVDAPASWDVLGAVDAVDDFSAIDRSHAALYFPRLRIPDPLQENELEDFAPCGAVAGVISRTDATRGVWKAPAGIEAKLEGVLGLSINGLKGNLTDGEVGRLNPIGVNCLRAFPVIGHVVWGARTLEGADALASQWKYVPVRRLALFIEESLVRGTQWVVFEPNDEPLWAQIRINVGAFMHTLFRQGAFQGTTPQDAYFVKCSSETTTQADVDNGTVNIVVGFAPLKPAEFVVISIRQWAPLLPLVDDAAGADRVAHVGQALDPLPGVVEPSTTRSAAIPTSTTPRAAGSSNLRAGLVVSEERI